MINNLGRSSKLSTIILISILGLAFYITYSFRQDYSYPIHGDEWVHWAYSEAILQTESITFGDPFFGEATLGPTTNMETGFHLFWVMFRLITDISWLDIFRCLPSVIFMITVLMVYVLTAKEGFGLEAALFTCLMPTTVGILGPALLVPVAIGMLFAALIFYFVFNFNSWLSYLIICIVTFFILSMHPPSAIIICTMLIPYTVINMRGNFKHSLGIVLSLLMPFVASLAWAFDRLAYEIKTFFTFQHYEENVSIPSIIETYGYLPIVISILGIVLLLLKGGKKNYGLVFGLLTLTILLVAFARLHFGIPILYQRGLLYLILMLAILAGVGLASVRTVRFPIKSTNRFMLISAKNVGSVLFLVIACVVLVLGIPSRLQTYHHQFINEEDYQAFVWIRDNLNEQYQKALLDPWKATAFTAITQKNIFTRIHDSVKDSDEKAYEILEDGCIDISFLRENAISIIYGQCDSDNPELIEIRNNIYVLREVDDE